MEAMFLKLLNMSLTAGWLVLAVIVLRILLRRAPKWTRCLLWALVAVRLLLPFSIESALSLIPSAEPLPQEAVLAEHPRLDTGIPPLNTATAPVMERAFAPNPGDSVNPLQIYTALGSWLWLAGAAAMLLYALLSYLRLRRQAAASIPITQDSFLCDAIDSPFILGVLRPRIYLPSGLAEPQQSHVLAHERAHLKRRDHWWKPLGWLLLSVYWFNPLLWPAYFLFCRDIELACDEKVLRELTKEQRIDYSQALLDLARPRAAVSACPVAFGETGVRNRVKSALNYKKPAFWIVLLAILAMIVTAVCLLTDPKKEEKASQELQETAGERGYSMSRGPTIIFQGDAQPVTAPSSSAAPTRIQAVADALEPLMDVSTQPAVLVSRRTLGGEVSGPYPLQNDPNLAHLANMFLTEYAYAGTAPHIDGMEEIRIECPELGWTASAYAALGEDTVELPGAWYFESSEYSGWLTYLSDVGDDGTFYFPSFYGSFRAFAFDMAEYLSFSPELITPNVGQGWLAAAQELAPHCYDAALKVSPGSTYGLSYVTVTRINPEEISEVRRQLDGLGEQDGEVSITVVFVPENERALTLYLAGNTIDYTGSDPSIPPGAYQFSRLCSAKMGDDGNWHLEIMGTG